MTTSKENLGDNFGTQNNNHKKEHFADDLDQQENQHYKGDEGFKSHNNLADKWNEIQEEYMGAHPGLDTADLYFEGGGFNGMLLKISEITGKSIDAVRKEIEEW